VSQQLPLPFGLDPEFTFERFLAGPNLEAVRLLTSVAEGSGPMPVFIHGPSGSGKTHLLQATCMASGHLGQLAMTLPLTLVKDQGPSLIEGLDGLDCLCLDGLECIAGEMEWEHALFSLFNALKDQGARLVIAANTPPGQLPFALADLRSRMASGPIIALKPLSELETIQAMIGYARSLGLEMSKPVAQYLFRRVDRDLGSLLRHLDQLDRASMAAARKLTIPFIRTFIDPGT